MIGIYARYSDPKQDRNLTIEVQERGCRSFIEQEGFRGEVRLFADRGVSGRSFDRPAFRELWDAVQARLVETVIVYNWRRFGRNLADGVRWAEVFGARGARVLSATEGNDRLTRNLSLLIADDESRHKSARVSAAREEHARRGHWQGAAPFGYRLIETGGGHRTLEIVKEQARVVRKLDELYAGGLGYSAVAQELNRLGIPPPRAMLWESAIVRRVLNNPIYCGQMIQCRVRAVLDPETNKKRMVERPASEHIVVPVPELRIIPEPLEARVKAELEKNASAYRKSGLKGTRRPRLPLSGLVKCGTCDASFVSRPRGRGRGRYLRCTTRRKDRAACGNAVYVSAERLLSEVVKGIEMHVWTEVNIQRAIRAGWKLAQEVQGADSGREARLAEAERGLERLVRLAERGGGRLETVARRIEKLEAERAELARPRRPRLSRADVEREIRRQLGRTHEVLQELRGGADPAIAEYKQVLGSLIEQVTVFPDRRVYVRAALSPVGLIDSSVSRRSCTSPAACE